MSSKSILDRLRGFEDIKHIDDNGVEYWSARELMTHFGYDTWENFDVVIRRARTSAKTSSTDGIVPFRDVTNRYKRRNRWGEYETEKRDYHLTRAACYVVAQNGDPSKPAIAGAQAYFAQQTIRQEQYDKLPADLKRLYVRLEVTDKNKQLNVAAKSSGVTDFANFHDAGYQGLYGMRLAEIVQKKDIGKDKLLDRAGTTELAANLFRITQTEEQLSKQLDRGRRIGQTSANLLHREVGQKVRQTIKEIGGTMPENLLPEPHIKDVIRRVDSGGQESLPAA